ncbi:transposase, partial [Shigella flexneri]
STLKSPSYTKSVSWQHYPRVNLLTFRCFKGNSSWCVIQ